MDERAARILPAIHWRLEIKSKMWVISLSQIRCKRVRIVRVFFFIWLKGCCLALAMSRRESSKLCALDDAVLATKQKAPNKGGGTVCALLSTPNTRRWSGKICATLCISQTVNVIRIDASYRRGSSSECLRQSTRQMPKCIVRGTRNVRLVNKC